MTSFRTYLVATAALGAVCAPAIAQNPYPYGYQQDQQTYPQQYPRTYPQQYPQTYPQQAYPGSGYNQGYGYNQGTGNPITDVIDSLLGNRYSVTDRQAVRQCATAASARASQQYGSYGYNRGGMRVTSITGVERRGYGLRVSGTLSSGAGYGRGYGNQYGYQNRGYSSAVSFRCNVAYNGAVTGIRIGRN